MDQITKIQNERLLKRFIIQTNKPIIYINHSKNTIGKAFEEENYDIKTDDKYNEQFNINWTSTKNTAFIKRLQLNQTVNSVPGQFCLFRKDNLNDMLKRFQYKHKIQQKLIPQTFILPDHKNEFLMEINAFNDADIKIDDSLEQMIGHKDIGQEACLSCISRNGQMICELPNGQKTTEDKQVPTDLDLQKFYIYKKACAARGEGVQIVHNLNEIDLNEESVVQEYLSNTMLLDSKKFDLRVYVLVISIDPLIVLMYDKILVRTANKEYQQPSENNYKDNYIHLTNYSIGKTDNQPSADRLKLNFDDLEQLNQESKTQIKQNIAEAIRYLFAAAAPTIRQEGQLAGANALPRKCFGLYGLDYLVQNDYSVVLLEVNISPSSAIDGKADKAIKPSLFKNVIDLIKPTVQKVDNGIIVPIIGKEDGSEMLRNDLKKQIHPIKYFKQLMNENTKLNDNELYEYEKRLLQQFDQDQNAAKDFTFVYPHKENCRPFYDYTAADLLVYLSYNK